MAARNWLAEQALRDRAHCPVHVLRIGNVAGADALLGPRPAQSPIVLDPVPGRVGGPLRSWIGPRDLAAALAALCRADLPPVLNLAQDPPAGDGRSAGCQPPALDLRAAPRRGDPDGHPVTSLLQGLLRLPAARADVLARDAAWARGVLA